MPNQKVAILIRTKCPPQTSEIPDATEISYEWAETVKQTFEARGWQIIDFAAENAVKSQIEPALQKTEIDTVIFYGHGYPNCMTDQNSEPFINCDNKTLLIHQKVYVVACWTAQKLGKELEEIARCYLGYDKEVMVWFEPPYSTYTGECANKGILEMLNTPTCTFEQARQKIIAAYSDWIDYFLEGDEIFEDRNTEFAADLRHNRDALRLFGDTEATL